MRKPHITSRCWYLLLIMLSFMLVSACSSSSPDSPPTYCLVFDTDRQVNTGVQRHPLPIKIRTLLLRSDAEFMDADFFSLQNDTKNVLGNSLLDSDQFFLTPGQRGKKLQRQKVQDARFIGVIAEYQILNGKVWRLSLSLPRMLTTDADQECQSTSDRLGAYIVVGATGLRTININK
ncbi:type VI secretion system lipoprotein TssJ [Yersinia intermedia]|uniref:type VI secretion system lipoprotein TssJ n=1 Tax=Yersinia intermedia TaxID=631 RepID=UPI0030CFCD3B